MLYLYKPFPAAKELKWLPAGGCGEFTDFGFLLMSEKTRVEVPNAERQLTFSSSCGFLKAMQGCFIKSEVRGDASALMPSLWTGEMEHKLENSFSCSEATASGFCHKMEDLWAIKFISSYQAAAKLFE